MKQSVALAPDGGPIPVGSYTLRVEPADGKRYFVTLDGRSVRDIVVLRRKRRHLRGQGDRLRATVAVWRDRRESRKPTVRRRQSAPRPARRD